MKYCIVFGTSHTNVWQFNERSRGYGRHAPAINFQRDRTAAVYGVSTRFHIARHSDRTGNGRQTPNASSRVRIQPCILYGRYPYYSSVLSVCHRVVMRRVSCQAPLCSITHYYAFRVPDPFAFTFEHVKAVMLEGLGFGADKQII